MNLVKGNLQVYDNRIRFISDAFSFDMEMNEKLVGFQGRELILGVRPESLVIGTGNIHGTVEFVEHLGAEKIIYIKVGIEKFIARTPPEKKFYVGEKINMSFKEANIHIFHQEKRIGI
jgi:multiple sugar transport system ATP-binding protein